MADDNRGRHAAPTRRGSIDAPRAREPDDTQDAASADHLRRHDPSRPAATSAARTSLRGREVAWVRASDVLAQRSGRVAGRGITWTATANQRPRLAPLRTAATSRRAIARAGVTPRRSRLAPVTAFGARHRSTGPQMGVSL